jgi:hypothetical protein
MGGTIELNGILFLMFFFQPKGEMAILCTFSNSILLDNMDKVLDQNPVISQ